MRVIVTVTLGSLRLRNSDLERLEVRQALGEHTRCLLEFTRDEATDVQLEELLGATAQVALVSGDEGTGEPTVVFQGVIAEGNQSHHMHYGSRFVIEAVSLSIRHEFRNTAYFSESTIADVAGRLGASLSAGSTLPMLDLVQYGETDFDFLKRLADDNGLFVRTVGPQMELCSGFGGGQHTVSWGDTLLAVTARARPTNHGAKGAFFRMEDKHDHRFHGIREDAPRTGGAASVVAAANGLASQAQGGGDPLVNEVAWRSKTMGEWREALARESRRASGSNVEIHGESTLITLRVGDGLEITATETFKPPVIGALGLIEVVHRFDGQTYSNTFVATTWATYTNRRRPQRHLVPGPVTAEVVEIEDPHLLGRIKVRYRWMPLDQVTRWLRVATPYTGNERGVHFTPEIGDEVLVAFEQGDPERAYVIGALWNGKDLAPQAPGMKRIITRTGNTIEFADEPEGREHIEIYSPRAKCWIQLATDQGGEPLITIHSEGNLALEAVNELRLTSRTLVVETEQDAFVKVGGGANVDVQGNTALRSGGTLGLQGGSSTTIKSGGSLSTVAGAINTVVGSMVHIQPPGFAAPPITPSPAPARDSVWSPREVPTPSRDRSTEDPPTPRNG
jgi:type VI secretion system secreted protein VgrG